MKLRPRVCHAFAVVLLALSLTGCSGAQVVDFLGSRGISIDQPTAETIAQRIVERKAAWDREVQEAIDNPRLRCVRYYESDYNRAHGPLYLNGSTADNPKSSAGGFYQWIDSSWGPSRNGPGVAAMYGFPQYSQTPRPLVPPDVQHIVTIRYLKAGGWAWSGDPC